MRVSPAIIIFMMKKLTLLFLAVSCLLCSCTRQGPALYRGSYSFKTGGSIDITGEVLDIVKDTVKTDTIITGFLFRDTSYRYHVVNDTIGKHDTTFTRRLLSEKGQMHIVSAGADSLMVTMNITGGDPLVFSAAVLDGSLRLQPSRRSVSLSDENIFRVESLEVLASGSGKRFEDVIIFEMDYRGNYQSEGFEGMIVSSNIKCVATENE